MPIMRDSSRNHFIGILLFGSDTKKIIQSRCAKEATYNPFEVFDRKSAQLNCHYVSVHRTYFMITIRSSVLICRIKSNGLFGKSQANALREFIVQNQRQNSLLLTLQYFVLFFQTAVQLHANATRITLILK